MTLDEIRDALQDRRLDKVSEATGIHRNTLSAIRRGINANPSFQTMDTLARYLSGGSWQSFGSVAGRVVRDVEIKRNG